MDTINNFITDLLDVMLNSNAHHTLKLRPGHKPSFVNKSKVQFVPGYEATRFDELIADFGALGITGMSDGLSTGRSIMVYTRESPLLPAQFSIAHRHERGALHITISQVRTTKKATGGNV